MKKSQLESEDLGLQIQNKAFYTCSHLEKSALSIIFNKIFTLYETLVHFLMWEPTHFPSLDLTLWDFSVGADHNKLVAVEVKGVAGHFAQANQPLSFLCLHMVFSLLSA